jgi:hypothetical protein
MIVIASKIAFIAVAIVIAVAAIKVQKRGDRLK